MAVKLNPDKIGVKVVCTKCHRQKAPRGRSVPLYSNFMYCQPVFMDEKGEGTCHGYRDDPKVGSLWPGESEEDFGYPVENEGTTLSNKELDQ